MSRREEIRARLAAAETYATEWDREHDSTGARRDANINAMDALAPGQCSIDETSKRLEECGTPATCGECAHLEDEEDTGGFRRCGAQDFWCNASNTWPGKCGDFDPKPAPSTPAITPEQAIRVLQAAGGQLAVRVRGVTVASAELGGRYDLVWTPRKDLG